MLAPVKWLVVGLLWVVPAGAIAQERVESDTARAWFGSIARADALRGSIP